MNKQESFTTICPSHLQISKHIAFYYFHKTHSANFQRTFTYYPNYHIALNLFKGSEIKWDDKSRFTSPANNTNLSSIVTFTTKTSRDVVMQGKIDKIGIIFQPLGLNHFIDVPLSSIITGTINNFNDFCKGEKSLIQKVFSEESLLIKRDLLDQLFLKRYRFFDEDLIKVAVDNLLEEGGEIEVQALSQSLGINRKTLLRKFKKHVCCSVKSFSQLIKFRNALMTYKVKKGDISMTDLAYKNQYYDQSSFIKHVNAVTGINPKKLFLELNDFADKNTIWTLKE